MTILTCYTAACYKAQIRSKPGQGFKKLYTASSTSSDQFAAQAVVRKWFGEAAADTVRQVKDAEEIHTLVGDFFQDPKRKQVFNVWTFTPRPNADAMARREPSPKS